MLQGGLEVRTRRPTVKTTQMTGPPINGTSPLCVLRPAGLSTSFNRMAIGRKVTTNIVTVRVAIIDKYMSASIGPKSH